jgi:hypothetical protein
MLLANEGSKRHDVLALDYKAGALDAARIIAFNPYRIQ